MRNYAARPRPWTLREIGFYTLLGIQSRFFILCFSRNYRIMHDTERSLTRPGALRSTGSSSMGFAMEIARPSAASYRCIDEPLIPVQVSPFVQGHYS
jgi:hypothetical protein